MDASITKERSIFSIKLTQIPEIESGSTCDLLLCTRTYDRNKIFSAIAAAKSAVCPFWASLSSDIANVAGETPVVVSMASDKVHRRSVLPQALPLQGNHTKLIIINIIVVVVVVIVVMQWHSNHRLRKAFRCTSIQGLGHSSSKADSLWPCPDQTTLKTTSLTLTA